MSGLEWSRDSRGPVTVYTSPDPRAAGWVIRRDRLATGGTDGFVVLFEHQRRAQYRTLAAAKQFVEWEVLGEPPGASRQSSAAPAEGPPRGFEGREVPEVFR